jgi:hypothetical protein
MQMQGSLIDSVGDKTDTHRAILYSREGIASGIGIKIAGQNLTATIDVIVNADLIQIDAQPRLG